MKHYKDSDNTVYAFDEDGSQDAFIKDTMAEITISELEEILNPLPTAQDIEDYISIYRKQVEIGGIDINGATIQTDSVSRSNILGALQLGTSINWKTDSGFVEFTNEEVSAIAVLVGQHVQKCFSAEKSVYEAHLNSPLTSIADAETEFNNVYSSI